MSTVRSGYVIGSTAPSWDRPAAPRHEPTPRKEPVERVKTAPKASIHPALRLIAQVLIAVSVFAACSGVIFMRAMVSRVQLDVNAVKKNISQLETENSRLLEEKNMAMDIQHIQQSASEMGMNYPAADQIRYIQPVGQEGEGAGN